MAIQRLTSEAEDIEAFTGDAPADRFTDCMDNLLQPNVTGEIEVSGYLLVVGFRSNQNRSPKPGAIVQKCDRCIVLVDNVVRVRGITLNDGADETPRAPAPDVPNSPEER